MRPPGSALLLALAACSIENPAFKVGPLTITGGGADDSTTAGPTTGPAPTTTTTSTGPVTTGDLSTSSGTTGEPQTSTGLVTETTAQPPADLGSSCGFPVVSELKMYAVNQKTGDKLVGCGDKKTYRGPAIMTGSTLTVTETQNCAAVDENDPVITLGDMHPTKVVERKIPCAEILIYWHPEEDCRIGTLQVIDVTSPDPSKRFLVHASRYNHPEKPDTLVWPETVLEEACGCDDVNDCCQKGEPGYYRFTLANNIQFNVGEGEEQPFLLFGRMYRFVNVHSHIDETCKDAGPMPYLGRHFDWFAELTEP